MPDKLNETFTDTKPWYLSKGVMGPVVSIVLGIITTYTGMDFTAEEVDQATVVILGVGTSVFGVIGLWGRLKAKKTITMRKKP